MKKYLAGAFVVLALLTIVITRCETQGHAASARVSLSAAEQEAVVKTRLRDLAKRRFGGDWKLAFAHYAPMSGGTESLARDEVLVVLEDAGVGSWMTRGLWADRIIEALDRDGDEAVSLEELDGALRERG